MDIIQVKHLVAGYDGTAVLKDLNFSVPQGEITVILGSSGCGKSTLLKTLVGLIPPVSGEIHFLGMKLDPSLEASYQLLYQKIGVLYQNSALLNSLNLFENVALPLRMSCPEMPEDIIREMVQARLTQVGLAGSAGKYPEMLSGGMRKRGALARALILDPDVIFCDEPSSGLDPVMSTDLDELLLHLTKNLRRTLVVVTHELRSIEKISDRVIVLKDGAILFRGRIDELRASRDPFIRSFFLKKESHDD